MHYSILGCFLWVYVSHLNEQQIRHLNQAEWGEFDMSTHSYYNIYLHWEDWGIFPQGSMLQHPRSSKGPASGHNSQGQRKDKIIKPSAESLNQHPSASHMRLQPPNIWLLLWLCGDQISKTKGRNNDLAYCSFERFTSSYFYLFFGVCSLTLIRFLFGFNCSYITLSL